MTEAHLAQIRQAYGVTLAGDWDESSLDTLHLGLNDLCTALLIPLPVASAWLRALEVRLADIAYGGLTWPGHVQLRPAGLTTWTVVHELGHAWDMAQGGWLSWRMMIYTGSWGPIPYLHERYRKDPRYWYHVGNPPPPCGIDENFNRLEDFAEAVAAYVYPQKACEKAQQRHYAYSDYGFSEFQQTKRGRFIASLIYK